MRLTEIQIDRHDMWRNLTLPVHPCGLTVIYGPNEAGKSTLRQFIRGMLFGFSKSGDEPGDGGDQWLPAAGSLKIEDSSGAHRIHRAALARPAGEASSIEDDAAPSAPLLDGFLQGVDEEVFEGVFAVGLREMTELSSLSGDEVARHLFGLSLGPTGGRILEAARRAGERRSKLIDPLQQHGELVQLFERHDEMTARLNELGQLQGRHTEWSLRRDQLEREIADLRKRHAGTAEQLRGHEFMERIWGPWDRIRECRHELDDLPVVAAFPERGLERLEKLDTEIAAAAECRDRLLAEVRRLREEALRSAQENARRTLTPAVRGFIEQRDWLLGLHERREAAQQTAAEREREFASVCNEMGPEWSAMRVEAADVSVAAQRRLSGTAESFRLAISRAQAIRRKCRRIAEACRDLKESLAESLHDLEGSSIDAALAQARERVAGLDQLAALKREEAELQQRLTSLEQQRLRIARQLNLPRWVYVVLGVFAFMGVILAGWGLVAGVATSGIAGAIYAMLGVTCGGLAWGLKIQYEGDARARLAEIESASAAAVVDLGTTRDSIRRLNGGDEAAGETSEIVCKAQTRIGELLELARHQRRLGGMRRKLAPLRQKLATARREVATARHNWRELLAGLGFPETLRIDEALAAWQLLAQAAERLSVWKEARRELQTLAGICDDYQQRILELAGPLDGTGSDNFDALVTLSAWKEQLDSLERRRNDRREDRRRLRLKQREARECRKRVARLKLKRNALLMQGGASGRDEFEDRARSFARRVFLEDQMHDAERDLDVACAAHTDLALVEEDLERFDPRQNSDCIQMLRLEMADLERDIERALEHLGGVKHELDALENDNQATRVRFQLRQIEEQLRRLAGEWAACESASKTIEEIRRDFERTHQPRALAEAGSLFSRMTLGKYRRIWTPLGERRLIAEDDLGHSFPVQSLSRGTREQLLLAVRLAVVRELSGQGISLPMILDDVIVNFDEERALATVDLLLELGGQGQQLLFFTCHKHLAQLFANRGIDPIWLPGRAEPAPQRLAG